MRTGPLVRLVAVGVAGLLIAVGMFALLLYFVDVPVTVTKPALRSPIIAVMGPICDCLLPEPSRVEVDIPPLHDLLTPLKSLVAQETFTDELVDLRALIDIRLIELHEAAGSP